MKLSEQIRQHYEAVRTSSNDLLNVSKSLLGERLDMLSRNGFSQGIIFTAFMLAVVNGVTAAVMSGSWTSSAPYTLFAGFLVLSQWIATKGEAITKRYTLEAADRYAEYITDAKLLDARMYACAMLSACQDRNAVVFVASDGTRYLVQELIEEIVHMTPHGMEYFNTVAAYGATQQGEYKCVALEIFDSVSTDEKAATVPRPDPLSN